jgi:hypothetical protein
VRRSATLTASPGSVPKAGDRSEAVGGALCEGGWGGVPDPVPGPSTISTVVRVQVQGRTFHRVVRNYPTKAAADLVSIALRRAGLDNWVARR